MITMKEDVSLVKMIVFADLHTDCTDKIKSIDFSSYNADVCFTLGDIDYDQLCCIKKSVSVPIYGVGGNHDEIGMLAECGIIDAENAEINIADELGRSYMITGISGSSKYKDGNFCMLTQRQSLTICKKLIDADILISHDCAYGLYGDKYDAANCGLKGISKYIKTHNPIACIHGHNHENAVKIHKKTIDICVFGCSIISFVNGRLSEIIHIF